MPRDRGTTKTPLKLRAPQAVHSAGVYTDTMFTESNPLSVVVSMWKKVDAGFRLPGRCTYGVNHVVKVRNMLSRNLHIPYVFTVLTDNPQALQNVEAVRVLELWDDFKHLGGCYNRLKLFSNDMEDLLGKYFVHMDLDVVITGDVTPIFNRKDDFCIHRYQSMCCKTQAYNGSLFSMRSGARRSVWDRFSAEPEKSLTLLEVERKANRVVGSDQAWIRLVLGDGEKTIGPEHGVCEYNLLQGSPPSDARLVFFSGKSDPSTEQQQWVSQCYL